MTNKEKLIAAVRAFQSIARVQLAMVEVEKEGDEDTPRFGLADEDGNVQAILLTDNSKYTAVGLGKSLASDNE